ncbi:MAG: dihydroorotate dehydrogenase [Clostridiales bacterium]|jgi:dihydroorotate dehydrogenase (NAD+) catalytic subunit|nr:dihydroorotate dehydrogenase [Clostridiales bacterium]
MAELKVNLCGITLDNPIIPASGTFGYGHEFAGIYDINILGTFSFKGTTREPRFGNNTPRIAECPSGLLNSVGLQNPGIHSVINEELLKLNHVFHKKVMANVCGFSVEEYIYNATLLDQVEQVGWIELNISCPNIHNGGLAFGGTVRSAYEVVYAVRKEVKKPIIPKLSPNVSTIAEIASACEAAGADGVSLINTLLGLRIDLKSKKPVLANITGGLSGPAILPVALRMIYEVYKAVKIPIIGMGGISSAGDVIEAMLAGATAVEVGSANLINPYACRDIIDALPETMDKYNIKSLSEVTGGSHG